MEALAGALVERGFAVLRFNFPYAEASRRVPDRQAVLVQTWLDVLAWAREQPEAAGLPLLVGGRSMGGRMASLAAADAPEGEFDPNGLILFAYPLHPPGRTDRLRREHLSAIGRPMLFISGTRDTMADVELMETAVKHLGRRARLHWLEGADHGFHVLRRSGRTDDEVRREAAEVAEDWCSDVLASP
jgi:predicted alpha/beta-hydrolase family hydrolase